MEPNGDIRFKRRQRSNRAAIRKGEAINLVKRKCTEADVFISTAGYNITSPMARYNISVGVVGRGEIDIVIFSGQERSCIFLNIGNG